MSKQNKQQKKARRQSRIRAKLSGTPERPRMCVSRSLTGMYIQIIDDVNSKTLASVNSKKDIAKGDAGDRKGKTAESYLLGKALAEKAKSANIKSVVFDRAGDRYHGRVKAAAEGARDGGLIF